MNCLIAIFSIVSLVKSYDLSTYPIFQDIHNHVGFGYVDYMLLDAIESGKLFDEVTHIMYSSCRDQENFYSDILELGCQMRSIDASGGVRNMSQLIHLFADFCEDEIKYKSLYINPFLNSHNSVLECVRIGVYTALKQAMRSSSNVLRHFHPIVVLPPNEGCEINWMWDLPNHQISSSEYGAQNGQDGVLNKIFQEIGSTNRYYVEIGYNADHLTRGSNTYMLNSELGWNGLLLDAQYENKSINLHKHFITTQNIISILQHYNVPYELDYLSVDIDSSDLWIGEVLLSPTSPYRPRVVSFEYNSHFPIGSTITMPPVQPGDKVKSVRHLGFGSSAGSLKAMLNSNGYEVVMLVGTLDIIAIRKDILGSNCPLPYAAFSNQVSLMHLCVHDDEDRGKWVEYHTWKSTGGDIVKSRRAALEHILLMNFPSGGSPASPHCLGFR